MASSTPVARQTVDLSAYPDLIVIYLGMKPNSLRGLRTMTRLRKEVGASIAAKPDGLLLHDDLIFSLIPPHLGMRQYWRDLDSLERWTREGLHRDWWTSFLKDPGGTSFWHETYRMRGGFEAIYDAVDEPVGMMRFAPVTRAKGPMFSARARLEPGVEAPSAPVLETELD